MIVDGSIPNSKVRNGKGCDSSQMKKKTRFQNMGVLSNMNFFVVLFIFSEQRSVQSEQQNPVFRQNRVLTSNFARNELFDLRKVL